jgi:hypothetical protein
MDRMNWVARIKADRALSAIASALLAANTIAAVPTQNDLLEHEGRPFRGPRGLAKGELSQDFWAGCIEIVKLEWPFSANQSTLRVGPNN